MDPGRVILITGGGGGMGRAIARRFLASGDSVVLADLSREGLDTASAAPGALTTVEADVTRIDDCERMITETARDRGRLDVLINAAGVWAEGNTWEATEADWDRVIDVNLKGTFFACRYAIPELMRTEGSIVNLSSDSGLGGNPGCAIYNASKPSAISLVEFLLLVLFQICDGDREDHAHFFLLRHSKHLLPHEVAQLRIIAARVPFGKYEDVHRIGVQSSNAPARRRQAPFARLYLPPVRRNAGEMVGVAQLVRASDCGSEGRRFKPDHPPWKGKPR